MFWWVALGCIHYHLINIYAAQINNAGIVIPGTVETVGIAAYDEQMNINCRVYYHLTHLSVPHLKKTKGVLTSFDL